MLGRFFDFSIEYRVVCGDNRKSKVILSTRVRRIHFILESVLCTYTSEALYKIFTPLGRFFDFAIEYRVVRGDNRKSTVTQIIVCRGGPMGAATYRSHLMKRQRMSGHVFDSLEVQAQER